MKVLSGFNSQIKQVLRSGLFKSSGIYASASFANALIPFILLPFLTNRLTPADYGIITMFATVQAFLFPILGFNLEGAVARKFYSKNTDLSVYIGNCLMIFFCTTILSGILFFAFNKVFETYTKIPSEWVMVIPVICASQFLSTLLLVLWQVKEKPVKYASFQIAQSTLSALLTIIFVLVLSYNWIGRLLAIALTTTIFATIAIIIFWKQKNVKFIFNLGYINHALKYGGGLVPHAIGGMLIVMTNRLFLTRMVSIEEAGMYGVANQICSVIGFLTVSFNNAYVPWLFKKLSGDLESDKLKIVKFTYLYFGLILLIGLVYYFVQPIIFHFFVGPHFLPALHYCLWITLGFVFQGMYFMVTNYINFAERTHIQALVTISVGIINIPLNYLCIRFFGSIGASISFATIFCLFFLSTWLLSSKVYRMPWFKFAQA